jgi:hypothetical protein
VVKIQGIVLDSATRRSPTFPLERAVGRFMLFYAHKAVFAAPVAKTRASEPPMNPFTCIPWHVAGGAMSLGLLHVGADRRGAASHRPGGVATTDPNPWTAEAPARPLAPRHLAWPPRMHAPRRPGKAVVIFYYCQFEAL